MSEGKEAKKPTKETKEKDAKETPKSSKSESQKGKDDTSASSLGWLCNEMNIRDLQTVLNCYNASCILYILFHHNCIVLNC